MLVTFDQLKNEFKRVLLSRNFSEEKADACATMFAQTTETGIYSHGVNRFPRFISQIDAGEVKPDAEATKILSLGAVEQWDGHSGVGNLTATKMMDRAMEIADQYGIGVVAIRNANHWMRGGTYGWQAAEKGYVGICWTNSFGAVPPWGSKEPRIGTNPLIVAVPGKEITMVDMSMSMFAYGALEVHRLAGKQLPIDGGFDDNGELTRDPAIIEKNRRILPMGYWKGSGLSIVLDMIATLLSDGVSVVEMTEDKKSEYDCSQVFIAIEIDKLISEESREKKLERIIQYIKTAAPAKEGDEIRLPGHEFPMRQAENRKNGITIDDSVWKTIQAL